MKPIKILVPTDNSETSFSAFSFAMHFADLMNAEVTLLKVIEGSFNTNEPLSFNPIIEAADNEKKLLKYFAEEYPVDNQIEMPKVKINYDVRYGIPGFTIADYAYDNAFDLIIMGSRNKRSIVQKILGTTSMITVKTAKTPVLLIHEHTKFIHPHKIVFGVDGLTKIEHALDVFNAMNHILKAKVDFLYAMTQEQNDLSKAKNEIIEQLFEEDTPPYAYEIKTIKGDNTQELLIDYCLFEKVDMLVLIHQQQGILESFFNKSFSINMIEKFHLPVMVIPELKPL
jgi:nucleotide-binding universal stress UspA family protein